jgi:DNA-binding NtrC family response regulator
MVLTAHGSVELATRAIQLGAAHFLTKPVDLNTLLVLIERTLDRLRTRRRDAAADAGMLRADIDPFLGSSAAIRELADSARRVLVSQSPVLILGETGSGKGVLAQWIHRQSTRARQAFVDINCAGLSRDFLESELFGHERGAFTGANTAKEGLMELAHRGTVFLDELGDMDPIVQAKLLKVIDEKWFRRLGGVHDRVVDVRIIGATHRDLAGEVREARFRADLYYRLSVLVLRVPPLRERREDIAPIAERMLGRLVAEMGRPPILLSLAARKSLAARSWRGNVRELRNVLERALLRVTAHELLPADLETEPEPALGGRWSGRSFGGSLGGQTLGELEQEFIREALEHEQGHVGRAAVRLGISRSALYERLRRAPLPQRAS